ncbi:MAG: hypothetical protein IPG94_16075 [Kineosporiaceae bacterium]|nr:hypothetical protein [Kineosporiaceae bacterium]
MTALPPMPPEQTASWLALLDLYERLDHGWTLIGGQLVHLHCAERGQAPLRPTNDVDTVIDVRADPNLLNRFTRTLTDIGFLADGISADGNQHRWTRGPASLDVLLPEGIGTRARARFGVTGSPTLPTDGGTQALHRTHTVPVTIDGRHGHVRRPNLIGALVAKAAAHSNPGDPRRHRHDFLTLAGLITTLDVADDVLTPTDRRRLSRIIHAINADRVLLLENPNAHETIARLTIATGLAT